MTDNLTSTQRRRLMGRVRCRDTTPEVRVRKIVHRLGFRFRLHRRDLPGTPDLVFPRHKKVIFVHGCFWHQHDCPRGRRPGTNRDFWDKKLDRNIQRDIDNVNLLQRHGWTILILWECETRHTDVMERRIGEFLGTRQ